ncbi:MAG: PP2C family protein-serine/threonine phosphatase [Parvibaculum sp.]|nr:PP2C family protein-serine/threonine phosphatase [Parvibaculum sp.]
MEKNLKLERELAEAKAEIARLQSEFDDLNMLYEATIEHGEAVEDELADKNILLQRTQTRLDEELADATRYVMSILPDPREVTPKTEWLLIPSTELGGDSFGYHEIDDDHMAFYLLDVCGHGVGAALLSVTAINVLRSSALPKTDFRDPAAVLGALNEAFPMEKQNNMYFTIWYGVYQKSTEILTFSSAGHPPSILLRGSEVMQLTAKGVALGTFPDIQYRSLPQKIEAGDRLLLLSDGAFEVELSEGKMLPFADFVAFLAKPGGDKPQNVLDWIRSINGEGPLPDDFSLLRVIF